MTFRRRTFIAALATSLALGGVIGASTVLPGLLTANDRIVEAGDTIRGLRTDVEALEEKVTEHRALISQVRSEARADRDALVDELDSRAADLDARESEVAAREDAVTATEEEIAANSFGNGVHTISEIIPGTYRTEGGSNCYWARLSGGGGGIHDLISNGLPDGPATVAISGSDWGFESSGCGTWTKVD